MAKKGTIFEEATGTFVGTLLEDMIDTVSRTHKMYCDVYIPDFFAEDYDHPLTYVPLWALSLPLRKGDKVMVEFHNGDLTLPVLYKNQSEIDEGFYSKFEFGDFVQGGNVSKPTAENTLGATRLGVDSYLIKTENYTVIHQNNGFILIDEKGKEYIYGSEINIVSTGNTNIDSGGTTKVFSKSSVEVKSNADVKITATNGFTVNNHLKVT